MYCSVLHKAHYYTVHTHSVLLPDWCFFFSRGWCQRPGRPIALRRNQGRMPCPRQQSPAGGPAQWATEAPTQEKQSTAPMWTETHEKTYIHQPRAVTNADLKNLPDWCAVPYVTVLNYGASAALMHSRSPFPPTPPPPPPSPSCWMTCCDEPSAWVLGAGPKDGPRDLPIPQDRSPDLLDSSRGSGNEQKPTTVATVRRKRREEPQQRSSALTLSSKDGNKIKATSEPTVAGPGNHKRQSEPDVQSWDLEIEFCSTSVPKRLLTDQAGDPEIRPWGAALHWVDSHSEGLLRTTALRETNAAITTLAGSFSLCFLLLLRLPAGGTTNCSGSCLCCTWVSTYCAVRGGHYCIVCTP
jgi:hypothetical protein